MTELPVTDMRNPIYDIYDLDTLIMSTPDKQAAERRVFAENCSYRKKSDQVWHMKTRQSHLILE